MATRYTILLLMIHFSASAFSQNVPIDEGKYVTLGGIEQWITIKGDNRENPAILFLHGGPGSVMSPFSDNIYGSWQKDFVLINWDQRGAGRTFGRNTPGEINENYWMENPLTLEQMVADGIELTRYLLDYLNKEKIIIIGTSWGSVLGTSMALTNPELFHAYLGNSQFVDFGQNLSFAYQRVSEIATQLNDTTTVQQLRSLGDPPYNNARSFGQLMRIIKRYEKLNSSPAPASWGVADPEYDNEVDNRNRFNGDDYSFIYFAGHEQMGIVSMAKDVNFNRDGLEFQIPVYFIQGGQDIATAPEITRDYFERISAPAKKYYLIPEAGHGQNEAVVEKEYQIVKELFK